MLENIRVLDISNQLGWLAGRIFSDLGAEVIKVEPTVSSKNDNDWRANNISKQFLLLDLNAPDGRKEFDRLVPKFDILIETAAPGSDLAGFLNPERLANLNAGLIHVSITPFGRSGPRAEWRASDIEIMAASGAMSLAGEREGTPLRVSVPQSGSWAGAHAAAGALVALIDRNNSGLGQLVEVSAQASIIAGLAHAPTFVDLLGQTPTRAGSKITGRSEHGVDYTAFWPCKDGYINFVLYGGPAGKRTNKALADWMKEREFDGGAMANMDWTTFDPKSIPVNVVRDLEKPIAEFFQSITKSEFLEEACDREMLGYPVSTVADISVDPQLQVRDFWTDIALPDGTAERHCGAFFIADGNRPKISAGETTTVENLLSHTGEQKLSVQAQPGSTPKQKSALAELKVVEFGGYAAGPHVGKLLANFGAEIVHVESEDRPDGFRLEYPPFKDGKVGVNRGGCFAFFNDSKYGVTLDLKSAEGLAKARKLIDWADIVIENMRPNVMNRLGLGYDEISKTNPQLIMLSTCNMGQTGPRAHTPGFGSQLSSLAGIYGNIGETDGSPMLLYGPYIDFIASVMATSVSLAALYRARRTSKGSYIDVSQYETGLHFMSGALLNYHCDGTVATRRANRDDYAAPHNAYRCRDDRWLALSCRDDDDFNKLVECLDLEKRIDEQLFSNTILRHHNAAKLDEIISEVIVELDAFELAGKLQRVGLAAYPVNDIADLFSDPQLHARQNWRRRNHAVIGDQAYGFPGFDLSRTPGDITKAAPLLGGDNEFVFENMLKPGSQ